MKKYFLSLISAVTLAMGANAQIADLSDGYYRINNSHTNRYIYVLDNKGELLYQQTTADMNAISLFKGLDRAISDPASVLYVEKHGTKYDITAQSTGIYQIISTFVNIINSRTLSGAYWAYGSQNGMTLYLYDAVANLNSEQGFLSTSGTDERRNWFITPIETNAENYFGVKPTLQVGDKYYLPFFADFPFSPASAGVKAYYVTKVDETNGYVIYKEITGTVPRSTPIFIECTSDQPVNNKLNLGGSASAINDNLLKGVYFENHLKKHENYVTYDKTKMRSLGITSSGKLGVVTGNYTDVPRNTFYLPVSTSAPAEMRLVTQEEYDQLVVVDPVYPTAINLSNTSLTMTIGDSYSLTATVKPDDTTDKTVTWASSNAAIVSVDASGKLSALGIGSATVTATCGSVSASCQVTVKGIEATSISLSETSLNLLVGDSRTLSCQILPANTTDKTVTWASSNIAVATVGADGTVRAIAPGQAVITVTCGSVSASCQVSVSPIAVTGITLNYSSVDLNIGEYITLIATISPDNATYKDVTWTSSAPAVVSVDANGKVYALSAGSASITATCGQVSASCQVNSKVVAVTGISLNYTSLDLNIGDTQSLVATVSPSNATYKSVTWTSSAPAVVSVDSNGKVSALAEGSATITATCGDVSAACQVMSHRVEAAAVTLSSDAVELHVGDVTTLIATVMPSNTTDKSVAWTSSNPAVASVSATGVVTAVALGTAEITASCGNVSAKCVVTVSPIMPTSIVLNVYELTLTIGEAEFISCQILPVNTTDKTVSWTSSDTSVATVAANGKVTAVGVGQAVITVSCGAVSASCQVSVLPISATSVSLNKSMLTLTIGEQETLVATVLPDNTTDPTVVWTSSKPSVATVDADGKVTAVGVGNATIKAKCGDVSAVCYVNVNPISANSVTLDCTELVLLIGDSHTLVATVEPEDTTNPSVSWSSSDPSVASVTDDGTVTANALGLAIITASCGNVSASCAVEVKPIEASSLSLDRLSVSIYLYDTDKLVATVVPDNTTDPTVVWTSSADDIVAVDQYGNIYGKALGSAMITATCGSASASCEVSVVEREVSELVLDVTELTMTIGESTTIGVSYVPTNATYCQVVWSTSDAAVASVDEAGNVTAVGVGFAEIKATALNGVSAVCSVNVLPIVAEQVTLDVTELSLKVDDIVMLTATVTPDNTTDKTVVWTSSDPSIATVDANGLVTAIAEGSATITAACGDVSATCLVNVLGQHGITDVMSDTLNAPSDIYTVQGVLVRSKATDLRGLPRGFYIINGQKRYVK